MDLTTVPFEKLVQTEVITASKLAKQVSDSPSAVAIVTADDIRTFGYRTLADVINSMRGLYTTSDRRYDYLGGRGFGSPGDYTGRVMLLVDGNAVQDNLYNQAFIDNSSLIDMALIERVEYVPGTGSVTYGNNALLGIINVITKKGSDFNAAQASVEAFSHGGARGRVTFGKQLDNGIDLLLSASRLHSRGQDLYFPYFDAIGANHGLAQGRDEESSDRLLAKLAYGSFSAQVASVSRDKSSPLPRKENAFNLPYTLKDRSTSASLRYDVDLSDKLKSSSHLYYGLYQDRALRQFGEIDPADQFRENHNKGQWWGLDQKFVSTRFDDHIVVFGAEFRDDTQQTLATAHLDGSGAFSYLSEYEPFHDKTVSAYLTDEFALNDVIKTNIGVRYDKPDAMDCSRPPCTAYAHKTAISPRVALSYMPDADTTLKGSYSRAFRIPNPSEVSPEPADDVLKPEQITATELVLQHDLTPGSRLTGSVYQFSLSGLAFVSSTSGNEAYDGESKTHGVELQYDEQWSNGIQLRTSGAWQRATDAEGKRLVNSPRLLGKLNVSLPVMDHAWRVGLESQHLGSRITKPIRNDNAIVVREGRMLGSVTTVNLTLTSAQKWHDLSVALSIKNLFDRRYEVPAPTVRVADNGAVLDAIAMDGRTVWLQLNYDFWR